MNNYDKSSTGINIDANVCYDEFMGRNNFEENFEKISDDIYLYVSYGYFPNTFELSIKETEENFDKIKDYLLTEGYTHKDIEDYEGYELTEELEEFCSGQKDFFETCEKLDISFTTRYALVSCTGFSQGDYFEAFVNIDEYEKGTGKEWSDEIESSLADVFCDFCYMQPLLARVEINEEELYVEGVDGYYLYYNDDVRDKIITYCLENSSVENKELLKEELEKTIPETI